MVVAVVVVMVVESWHGKKTRSTTTYGERTRRRASWAVSIFFARNYPPTLVAPGDSLVLKKAYTRRSSSEPARLSSA